MSTEVPYGTHVARKGFEIRRKVVQLAVPLLPKMVQETGLDYRDSGGSCCDDPPGFRPTVGNSWIPRLTGFQREGHFEIYDVEMLGRFGERIDLLGEVLLSSRHAITESTVETRPGHVRVVLNHLELPDVLRFDTAKIPDSPDRVYFGSTSMGDDLVWDLRENAHGLIVGANGSGKSEAAATALMQLHPKGWDLLIIPPTTEDVTFQVFSDLGHTVIAGSSEDHYGAARDTVVEKHRLVAVRERSRAVSGLDWFNGQPSIIAMDDRGDWLVIRKTDSDFVKQCKQDIQDAIDVRARRGRKIRDHLLLFTQEPYVANLGTPETLRQLLFRLAVTTLDRAFHPTVFQPVGASVAPNVARACQTRERPRAGGSLVAVTSRVTASSLWLMTCRSRWRGARKDNGPEYSAPPPATPPHKMR